MKPKIFLLLLLSLYIVNCTFYITSATVRYVSKTGSSTPPYTTWETAADSIMECINISVFGDTIYVANGTYKEQVVMIPGLTLIGAGSDSCFIDTRDLVTSQNFTSVAVADSCLLTGFHILVYYNAEEGVGISGAGSVGSSLITLNSISTGYEGIYLGDNPIVYKNFFFNVSVGIELFNANGIARKNIIYVAPISQLAIRAGIYIQAFDFSYAPLIDSNYIVTVGDGIRKSFGSSPKIKNNTIFKEYEYGIFVTVSDTVEIANNIIFGIGGDGINFNGITNIMLNNNHLAGNFGTGIWGSGSGRLNNNIITNSEVGIELSSFGDISPEYNDLWNNDDNYSGFTPDSTNIEVDPMVVNDDSTKGDLDFHLQMFSPLIDAGDPTILDKDGTRSDIGLYGGPYGEQYHYIDLAPRTPINLTATLDSLTVGLTWNKNTEADFNHYNVYRDTTKNFQIDSTNLFLSTPVANLIDILPNYVEKIYYKVTAVDNQDNESEPSEEVGFILTSVTDHQQTISDYRLYQNYPNPFNPSTKISYRLKERGYVKLYVYDIKGELISVLVNKTQEAGFYEVEFVGNGLPTVPNNSDLASGIYIYQIMVKNENNIPVFTDMKKMIYLK
ncbi:MAG TPA: right-handed parallel beta-helix repeat-containing protein [Ignavibacteriaceae bacterium]|nr:right-handed parallel beta-helix repeat-containing protein [Ignavibacteriaceae bacterium]